MKKCTTAFQPLASAAGRVHIPAVMFFLLGIIVLVAFAVEATMGFGATLIAVTLGAFAVPLDTLLPPFIIVDIMLSSWIVLHARRHVQLAYLSHRVVPWMILGVPLGVLAVARLDSRLLLHGLGLFIVALAALELHHRWRAASALRPPLPPAESRLLLWLGGLMHGAFATGGPLAIYVAGRDLSDKDGFRATLSTLWLLLNVVLLASYLAMGLVTATSAQLALVMIPSLAAGIAVGEWAHRRVSMPVFERLIFGGLAVAGFALVVG